MFRSQERPVDDAQSIRQNHGLELETVFPFLAWFKRPHQRVRSGDAQHSDTQALSKCLTQADITIEHLVVTKIIIYAAQPAWSATGLEVTVHHANHSVEWAPLRSPHGNKVGDVVFPRHQTRHSAREPQVVCHMMMCLRML